MPKLLFLSLLLFFVSNANSQIYKWIDEKGRVEYSDQPPPAGSPIVPTRVSLQYSSSYSMDDENTPAPEHVTQKEEGFKERRAAREEAKNKQLAEVNTKKEQCNQARSNMEILKNTPQLSIPDGMGGVKEADDNFRLKQMEDVKKMIASLC